MAEGEGKEGAERARKKEGKEGRERAGKGEGRNVPLRMKILVTVLAVIHWHTAVPCKCTKMHDFAHKNVRFCAQNFTILRTKFQNLSGAIPPNPQLLILPNPQHGSGWQFNASVSGAQPSTGIFFWLRVCYRVAQKARPLSDCSKQKAIELASLFMKPRSQKRGLYAMMLFFCSSVASVFS